MLIFAYNDVEKVVSLIGELRDEAVRVRVNAEKFLKPVSQQGCQHPKERLKYTNEGVFCLDCNAPVLTPVGPAAQPVIIPLPNIPPPAAAPHLKPVQVQGQTIFVPDKAIPKPPVQAEGDPKADQSTIPQESEPKKD